jgi:hypothetical protein
MVKMEAVFMLIVRLRVGQKTWINRSSGGERVPILYLWGDVYEIHLLL